MTHYLLVLFLSQEGRVKQSNNVTEHSSVLQLNLQPKTELSSL